jgi:hypothetical protein
VKSLRAPPPALLDDSDAFRQRLQATAQGLLALCGIDSDPVQGREHILVAKLLEHAARRGVDLSIADLVRQVQKPPFSEVGVLDLETFYPEKERRGLLLAFNNLLASPGFSSWLEGDPLDIPTLLFSPNGKPRISVLSISHLSDAERMFVMSLLLAEFVSWMRQQPGTQSLRCLLFVDEVMGFLPPVANPPTKPMFMTLLKQARAFGCGVLLATQNPADIDYKALANAGTWILGRLQTDRDRARVVEGVQGAAPGVDASTLQTVLASLPKRGFLVHSVHLEAPAIVTSRQTLSFLSGPLTPTQLKRLTATQRSTAPTSPAPSAHTTPTDAQAIVGKPGDTYLPAFVCDVELRFVDKKNDIDETRIDRVVRAGDRFHVIDARAPLEALPPDARCDGSLPVIVDGAAEKKQQDAVVAHLLSSSKMLLMRSKTLKACAKPGESISDFASRLRLVVREQSDGRRDQLRKKFEAETKSLRTKIDKLSDKRDTLADKASAAQTDATVAVGTTLLSALFGRTFTKTNLTKAASAARRQGKASEKKEAVAAIDVELAALRAEEATLAATLEQEAAYIGSDVDVALEEVILEPMAKPTVKFAARAFVASSRLTSP